MVLRKLIIRNFKKFGEVEIPLGDSFVFVGANNSGKTSALQALTLWYSGLQKLLEKHSAKGMPKKRPGVTINRLDLISLPISEVDLMWYDRRVKKEANERVLIELIVEGVSESEAGKSEAWCCGLEFDYLGAETFYCRPLRETEASDRKHMPIPLGVGRIRVAFLPAMSGLAAEEAAIELGRINVLIGQGQTAEVLRNLCYRVHSKEDKTDWETLVADVKRLFGVTLKAPVLLPSRGSIKMEYLAEDEKTVLELPSAGRGMLQVLMLLAYLYDNPQGTVFLLDEPDAHLELLRQREVYNLINEVAGKRGSQIIAASHSEVLLNQAAAKGAVVAFVGKPHLLAENKSRNVVRALREIGWQDYFLAEQKGWVLYLEGETDLRILQAFAKKLAHTEAMAVLSAAFVRNIGNDLANARKHFNALREAKGDLRGIVLQDRSDKKLLQNPDLVEMMWKKREIENYLCHREAIVAFATAGLDRHDLVDGTEIAKRQQHITQQITRLEDAFAASRKADPFSDDIKASDDFLVPLFQNFNEALSAPASEIVRKKDFYKLVAHIPNADIDPEVGEVLDKIVQVAKTAKIGNAK